jgi:hypothetical protein
MASAGPREIARACRLYPIVSGLYAALLAVVLSLAGVRRPDLVFISMSEWAGLAAVHVVLLIVTWVLSRTSFRNRSWLLALAPSPATVLAQCLLVGLLPDNMANSLGLFSVFLFCLIWNALIIPFAYELSGGASWERVSSMRALGWVGCLNLFCFLYLLDPAWRWFCAASR